MLFQRSDISIWMYSCSSNILSNGNTLQYNFTTIYLRHATGTVRMVYNYKIYKYARCIKETSCVRLRYVWTKNWKNTEINLVILQFRAEQMFAIHYLLLQKKVYISKPMEGYSTQRCILSTLPCSWRTIQ